MTEGRIFLLPPASHLCQTCASRHDEDQAHNAQSLYYQTAFRLKHGRTPTWADAMAHCSDAMKAAWCSQLARFGIDPDSSEVNPPVGLIAAPARTASRREALNV